MKYGIASSLRAAAALPGVAPSFVIADMTAGERGAHVRAIVRLFDMLNDVLAFAAIFVGRGATRRAGWTGLVWFIYVIQGQRRTAFGPFIFPQFSNFLCGRCKKLSRRLQ